MEEQKKQILNQNLRVLLFKFSLPAIIGMVIIALYNFVDTIFVGNIVGPNAIAGLTIALPVFIFIIAIGLLTGVGASSIVSRSLGGGDTDKALIAGGDSIVLNVTLSLIVVIPIYIFSEKILMFLGASNEVLPYARDYLNIMLLGFVFLSFTVNGSNIIRAEGKPRASMYVNVIGSVLNIILDYFFIVQFGWGVKGAAIATVISHIVSSVYIIIFFVSKSSIFKLRFKIFKINKSISREILSIGLPSFLTEVMGSMVFLLFIRAVRQYGGDVYIALTGIGIRIIDLIFMPILGISGGLAPLVSFNYGAKLYTRVKRVLREAFIWTFFITLTGFIIMVIFPGSIISIFTSDIGMIEKGVTPLRMIAMLSLLWSFPILGGTFFQAIGKPKPSLIIILSRELLFFIPAIFILPKFFDLVGVWISWPVTDLCTFIVVIVFLIKEIRTINRDMELGKAKSSY